LENVPNALGPPPFGRVFRTACWILLSLGAPPSLSAQAGSSPDGEPRSGWEGGSYFLQSADGTFRMTIGGRVQPRYQFRSPAEGEDTSSFLLRRVRLDVRGHVMDPRLTFRVMPELARTANLRDGWIDFAFDPRLQLRAGQFVVPFHWHRFISGSRQHFAERSLPAGTFGFPNGYDLGVAVHGRSAGRLAWAAGLFDGAGRNVAESNSAGHMASGRLTWAAAGELPFEEPDHAHSQDVQVSLGVGLQGATRNEVREWDLGRSPEGNQRADWGAGTVDGSIRWRGFSAFAEGYIRRVDPDDAAVETYSGWAHTVGAGYFFIPGRYEGVGRHSRIRLDRRDPATAEREWGLGLNVYHLGHLWKTHIQYLQTNGDIGTDEVFLIQLHLQF